MPTCVSFTACFLSAAVEFAEPDYLVRVDWQPDDTLVNTQWHLDTIHSQDAWNTSTGSREVKVRMGCQPGGRLWEASREDRQMRGYTRGLAALIEAVLQLCSPVDSNPSQGKLNLLMQVCHIDSGIETNHPDLHRRMLKGWNLVPEVQVPPLLPLLVPQLWCTSQLCHQ